MTSLQIDYWKLQESTRTNKANEGLRRGELNETTRHNKASEQIQWAQVGEQSRHNKATETIGAFSAIADFYNKYNWKQVQDAQIALQKQDVAIREQQNALRAGELDLATQRLSFDQERTWRELDLDAQRVAVQEQHLAIERWEEGRKWFTSLSSEGRGWSAEGRNWADWALATAGKRKKKKQESE